MRGSHGTSPYSKYPVCTMLDARKKEVYAALFKWEGENLIRLTNETSAKPEEFARDALRYT